MSSSCSEFLHPRLSRHSEGQLFKCSFGLQNNNIILLCISLKSSRNIFYTRSNIKICKSFRNKQTVKNLDTSTNAKNLHGWKFLGQEEEDMPGEKEDVWESYTTTTTVVPTPTTNTTTVAAQVEPVYCLITIQHEGEVFCDTIMCHLAKGS